MFDPVVDKQLLPQPQLTASYWSQNNSNIDTAPILQNDLDTDVVIVGAGYTGLSCAYYLSQHYNIQATVIDAGPTGWGCSGRNAGFVLNGTGRLSLAQVEQRFGRDTAQRVYREYRAGISNVEALITEGNIACDRTSGGYLKLAHNQQAKESLMAQLSYVNEQFNDESYWLDDRQVQSQFLHTELKFGAQFVPYCSALNPLKLAHGYAQLCANNDVQRFQQTTVQNISECNGYHYLQTSGGQIKAKQLVLATNGYSVNQLHTAIDRRHFPVLSSILVTAPLSAQQLTDGGFAAGLMAMDTRELKYYYRLLPDNRILFGGRGAITGAKANNHFYQQQLIQGLYQTLPSLKGINIDHFWSGWISVSVDDYPRIYSTPDGAPVHYAMGYCGSGVSFTTQAGKRLAQAVAGQSCKDIPHLTSPLAKIPFAQFKRLGLWGFYHLAQIKDKWG